MDAEKPSQRRKVVAGQHVWVSCADGTEQPGLLVWWDQRGTTWWGGVAMVDPDGEPAIAEVLASLIRPGAPAGKRPREPD